MKQGEATGDALRGPHIAFDGQQSGKGLREIAGALWFGVRCGELAYRERYTGLNAAAAAEVARPGQSGPARAREAVVGRQVRAQRASSLPGRPFGPPEVGRTIAGDRVLRIEDRFAGEPLRAAMPRYN